MPSFLAAVSDGLSHKNKAGYSQSTYVAPARVLSLGHIHSLRQVCAIFVSDCGWHKKYWVVVGSVRFAVGGPLGCLRVEMPLCGSASLAGVHVWSCVC